MGAIVIENDWSIVVRAGILGENVRAKLRMDTKHKVHNEYVRYHREQWEGAGGPNQS